MGRYCQLVMGPAGSGKSTYCQTIMQHCEAAKRRVHLVNLDPAAERFEYPPSIDIRDLITLEDVMDELGYGPNGGLVYCFEFLMENMDWLEEQLGDYEDDYLILDCPGQIELYTHIPIMRQIAQQLQLWNFQVVGIYCLESQFIEDTAKYFAGVMSATSAMSMLEIPHINVMTKMDLVSDDVKDNMDRYFDPDPLLLADDANRSTRGKFRELNAAIANLIDEFSMVSFLPLNVKDEDSVAYILSHADNAIQWGEDQEPKEPTNEIEDADYE
ncbi:hypothetical protein GGI04_001752 [Coemansia thaxteri]|uniref:GPN-loop GTPase 3 n=1 Tax=Coemansia thaxteri TaxID=2663907 RepID=A0A9W8BDP2_9FUNG|nr:hypothetical protein H4R26_003909 [Coemansia thaxteri]KAJ2006779.1 hypothetical protein GGI04_001752 [Coemansia thaxteri]KAJ2471513.1 hypothetical protein GGI02_002226 [Coemansia sp. RSA 2322]KAJ2484555.1 hypothetical protein EV174_002345 [Coemansia sp. RSA 2320]